MENLEAAEELEDLLRELEDLGQRIDRCVRTADPAAYRRARAYWLGYLVGMADQESRDYMVNPYNTLAELRGEE